MTIPLNLSPPLAPGFRGRKYFQLKSGEYILKWKITKGKTPMWPTEESFQKTIILEDYRPYVHILINGSEITVS